MRTRFALVVGLLACYAGVASAQVREEWVARYQTETGGASAIAVDGAGYVYVTGPNGCWAEDWGGCDHDYVTVKYDPDGNRLWVAQYNANSFDQATAIAVDDAGNVYVTGKSWVGPFPDGAPDYATIKYDPDGHEVWVARYDGPEHGSDTAFAIAVDAGGNVYVTGASAGVGTSLDYATIKYGPAGNELWVARYNGPGNFVDRARAIALDGAGGLYVTGSSFGGLSTFQDYATIKYDLNGNQSWIARYNRQGEPFPDDEPKAIAIAGGNVYVTGSSAGVGTGLDYATIKYGPAGNELWVARYDGPGNQVDAPAAIAVDSVGHVYVTGESRQPFGIGDYATVKYGTNGNELWVARYDGPGNGGDAATGLAIDRADNVYVTGWSYGGAGADYATVEYDTHGNQLWVARYNAGNSTDLASAIAVDTAGNVYVTGVSQIDLYEGFDYATIKYSQTPAPAEPLTPTITFGLAPTPTHLDANFVVSSTTTNTDSIALSYSAVSGPCAVVNAIAGTFSSTAAGTCRVEASGAATTNFLAASAQQDVVIAKAAATVTLSNLIRAYSGIPLSPTATTTPPGLTIVWTNAEQTNAGSYVVTATVNDPNYQGAASGTLVINPPASGSATPYRGFPIAIPGVLQAEEFDEGGEGLAYHDAAHHSEDSCVAELGDDLEGRGVPPGRTPHAAHRARQAGPVRRIRQCELLAADGDARVFAATRSRDLRDRHPAVRAAQLMDVRQWALPTRT
jgi:hypothetical protein